MCYEFVTDVGVDKTFFTGVRFRIQLKESEKLHMVGPCDLVVSEDAIVLYSINSGKMMNLLCVGTV